MHNRSLRRLLVAAAFFALALGASVSLGPSEAEANQCWNCQSGICVERSFGASGCIQGDGFCFLTGPCGA